MLNYKIFCLKQVEFYAGGAVKYNTVNMCDHLRKWENKVLVVFFGGG